MIKPGAGILQTLQKGEPKAADYILSEYVYLTTYWSDVGSSESYRMDIRSLITEYQIYESINHEVLSGVLVITDAAGMLDKVPLTGHELLEFTLHTPGFSPSETKSPRGFDFTMKSGFPMFVHTIRDISQATPGTKVYALEFSSKEHMKDRQRKICRAFTGPLHTTVVRILRHYLKSQKNLYFEPTKGNLKYVIPKKSPLDTIKFLCKESTSLKYNNSGYFFFETSDGFHFKSLESMISSEGSTSKTPIARYSDSPQVTGAKMYKTKGKKGEIAKGNMERVYEWTILNRFNAIKNIKKGVYASRLVTYNGFTKEFKDNDFSYPHEFEEQNHVGVISKGKKVGAVSGIMPIFNYEDNKTLNNFPEAKYMFTTSTTGLHQEGDYKGLKEGTVQPIETANIEQTLQKSISQKEAFNSIVIELVVPGNTAVTAGSVISFETLTRSDGKSPKIDPYLSGTYLVTEINHLVQKSFHNMRMICAKDTVGEAYVKNEMEIINKEKGKGVDINQHDIDSGMIIRT